MHERVSRGVWKSFDFFQKAQNTMVTRKKSIRKQTLCSKIIHFPFFFLLPFAFTESYERINISFFTYLVCQRSFLKFSFKILSSTLTHCRPKLVPLRMSYIMSTAVVDDFNLPLTFSTASQTWNWPQTEGLQLLSRIRKKNWVSLANKCTVSLPMFGW